MSHWIGFDLGGTKMLATVLDEELGQVGRARKKTKGQQGQGASVERIVRTIDQALEQAGARRDQLGGIGVGCPGPLDLETGVVLEAPNLGWRDVPLKERLEREFQCPTVVANDVDAGLYGEFRLGRAQRARCAVGVFPGTGIGGACVYEGRILRGRNSSCMEVGHLQVMPDGPLCGCGQYGCLEAVASRLAIAAAAAKAAYRGQAPHLASIAGTDLSQIRSGAIVAAIEGGDVAVEKIVRRAATFVGVAVASLVNLLAPDTVVLGGGLVEALPELYLEVVRETARNRVLTSMADCFRVVVSQLGDDATALGAAAWAKHLIEETASEGAESSTSV